MGFIFRLPQLVMQRIGRPLRRCIWTPLLLDSSKPTARFLDEVPPFNSCPYSSLPKAYSSILPFSSVSAIHRHPTVVIPHGVCCFCGDQRIEFDKEVDEINLKFAEAREEIEAALESKETVYFDEEAECAREAVKCVFHMFEGLLGRLPEKDRSALQRSMGLKMEQLKAELKQLDD
ncbi:hypothetical protein HPP92_002808 [Vanilla planifolia]|uniref:Late embryogenesis abundant protein n=2 Tax=Vanilla planifolia TaxID=51239 RepID=A0A835S5Z9_VANPL|nr:hypothetical protein HPP92_002808 [Vanilla planifolia]